MAQAQEDETITSVSPSYGWTDEEAYLYIQGNSFQEPLRVTLNSTPITVISVEAELIIAQIPLGMAAGLYNVTVERANEMSDTKYDAYQVLTVSNKDDLTSRPDWLWTEPRTLRVNGPVNSGVGLNLQRIGGLKENSILKSVKVDFILRTATGDEPLGGVVVRFIDPGAVVPTPKVIWKPETPGEHIICAIIDPENEIEEINPEEPNGGEGNNEICRVITVLAEVADTTAPIMHQDAFKINDGEPTTADPAVRVDVEAEDSLPNPRSGVDSLYFVEYDYISGTGWFPVQHSGWIPYAIAHQDYRWTLMPTYGIHYIRAWAMDKASNISRDSALENINLLPPPEQSGFVERGEVDFYRIRLEEGEILSTTLSPISGDPDLYIWTPSGKLWYDGEQSGIESVSFAAPEQGTYQIELHGYTAAEYRLGFEITEDGTEKGLQVSQGESDKELPAAPWLSISDIPSDVYVNPPPFPISNNIYLPIMTR